MNENAANEPLATEELRIERKIFYLDLRENARGRYFRMTEQVGSRRNMLFLPATAGREFLAALKRLAEHEANL